MKTSSQQTLPNSVVGGGGGKIDVLSGGFPCQPFSHAGKRGGADDDRYLWPQMLRAIREIHPLYVVGENVNGILSMVQSGCVTQLGCAPSLFGEDNEVFYQREQQFIVETVCSDLEREGYSVQPIVIPACAVGAPHIRNRVWFIAKRNDAENALRIRRERASAAKLGNNEQHRNTGTRDTERLCDKARTAPDSHRDHDCGNTRSQSKALGRPNRQLSAELGECRSAGFVAYTAGTRFQETRTGKQTTICRRPDTEQESPLDSLGDRRNEEQLHDGRTTQPQQAQCGTLQPCGADSPQDWWRDFPTVAPVCRGNDGLPFDVDGLSIPFNQWRNESIKAYGNSMVPQVVYEIFSAIQQDILQQ